MSSPVYLTRALKNTSRGGSGFSILEQSGKARRRDAGYFARSPASRSSTLSLDWICLLWEFMVYLSIGCVRSSTFLDWDGVPAAPVRSAGSCSG